MIKGATKHSLPNAYSEYKRLLPRGSVQLGYDSAFDGSAILAYWDEPSQAEPEPAGRAMALTLHEGLEPLSLPSPIGRQNASIISIGKLV